MCSVDGQGPDGLPKLECKCSSFRPACLRGSCVWAARGRVNPSVAAGFHHPHERNTEEVNSGSSKIKPQMPVKCH